jgi:hypothetical protein
MNRYFQKADILNVQAQMGFGYGSPTPVRSNSRSSGVARTVAVDLGGPGEVVVTEP